MLKYPLQGAHYSRSTLQGIFQQPMMIETCFNFLNILDIANGLLSSIRICLHWKKVDLWFDDYHVLHHAKRPTWPFILIYAKIHVKDTHGLWIYVLYSYNFYFLTKSAINVVQQHIELFFGLWAWLVTSTCPHSAQTVDLLLSHPGKFYCSSHNTRVEAYFLDPFHYTKVIKQSTTYRTGCTLIDNFYIVKWFKVESRIEPTRKATWPNWPFVLSIYFSFFESCRL